MALFGRDFDDELDNNYLPLEEYAPTISRQEVVKRKRLSDLIAPIRDIPTALKGRRDQIEGDLNSFASDQDEAFDNLSDMLLEIIAASGGHIDDVNILPEKSAIMAEQITTIDKSKLIEKIGSLEKRFMNKVVNPKLLIQLGFYVEDNGEWKMKKHYTRSKKWKITWE